MKSSNGPTFHDPPAHSNHPAEPCPKGMPVEGMISTGLVTTPPLVPAPRGTVHALGPTQPAFPRKHPALGLCNPYRIEFCLGTVTRGSHVPWQPRARICKSFRLVSTLDVFCWAKPSFVSHVSSTTTCRQRHQGPRFIVGEVTRHSRFGPRVVRRLADQWTLRPRSFQVRAFRAEAFHAASFHRGQRGSVVVGGNLQIRRFLRLFVRRGFRRFVCDFGGGLFGGLLD